MTLVACPIADSHNIPALSTGSSTTHPKAWLATRLDKPFMLPRMHAKINRLSAGIDLVDGPIGTMPLTGVLCTILIRHRQHQRVLFWLDGYEHQPRTSNNALSAFYFGSETQASTVLSSTSYLPIFFLQS
jgi:hypothetical protein